MQPFLRLMSLPCFLLFSIRTLSGSMCSPMNSAGQHQHCSSFRLNKHGH
jgi:hypothetical protein